MTVQISIIGLGQIGTSMGLALADHKDLVTRVGHDRRFEVAKQAEKLGAVDKVVSNLPRAIDNADLVMLALPMDQIRETMAYIAPDLKDGAVVMDTGPAKETTAAWAAELLPEGRHYIGLTPVINATYLHAVESGIDAARADLFVEGLVAIVAPPRASSEAIKLAADFTRLIGATPYFADPAEIDGIVARTHILPQLLAAGLLNATVDQPGWYDSSKLAGRDYAEVTGPTAHLSEPQTISSAVFLNRENVLRSLDSAIASLQALRSDIAEESQEPFIEKMERARQGRERWWRRRQSVQTEGDDATAEPGVPAGDMFGRLFGLGKRKPKK